VNARVAEVLPSERVAEAPLTDFTQFTAGRSCPIAYRYTPASLAQLPATAADTLYCVGGLYGNVWALDALEALLARERSADTTQVVFNGDFHWFDATPDAFAEVEARTLHANCASHGASHVRYARLRGNVETELASDDDAGCGCAYPDSVDDGVVARSNEILRHLRAASTAHPAERRALAALPMTAAYRVGGQRVVVVHGDLESLAGWRLDPKSLNQAHEALWAAGAMREANADIVASSHTCLPALRSLAQDVKPRAVVNNGSAGMPCFTDSRFGVVTRIGRESAVSIGLTPLYGLQQGDVWIEAIALEFDFDAWRTQFLSIWPTGSAAHRSYFSRIENGVDFSAAQACAAEMQACTAGTQARVADTQACAAN
jgi:predicted phosphodiesterase